MAANIFENDDAAAMNLYSHALSLVFLRGRYSVDSLKIPWPEDIVNAVGRSQVSLDVRNIFMSRGLSTATRLT